MVEPGKLDLTFGVLPIPAGPFDGVELMHDPFVLVVTAKASPLAGLEGMPTLELIRRAATHRVPLLPQHEVGREPAARGRARAELRLPVRGQRHRPGDGRAGLGTAIVPLMAVDRSDPSIAIIPTDLEPRRIALMWHRDRYRSPASRAFVDIALDVCAGLSVDLDPGRPPAG